MASRPKCRRTSRAHPPDLSSEHPQGEHDLVMHGWNTSCHRGDLPAIYGQLPYPLYPIPSYPKQSCQPNATAHPKPTKLRQYRRTMKTRTLHNAKFHRNLCSKKLQQVPLFNHSLTSPPLAQCLLHKALMTKLKNSLGSM